MRVNRLIFHKLNLRKHMWNQEAFQVFENVFSLLALILALLLALILSTVLVLFKNSSLNYFIDSLFSLPFAFLFVLLFIVLTGILGGFGLALAHSISQLKEGIQSFQKSSETDPLSQLKNRRSFKKILNEELNRKQRLETPDCLGLIFIDIDFFKKVNDTYGHNAGDFVIREISNFLEKSCRPYDTVARWGGEEIVILTPHTTREQLVRTAERLRSGVENFDFTFESQCIPITISLGLALHRNAEESIPQFVERADFMLLKAKESGRNRYCIGDESIN